MGVSFAVQVNASTICGAYQYVETLPVWANVCWAFPMDFCLDRLCLMFMFELRLFYINCRLEIPFFIFAFWAIYARATWAPYNVFDAAP